MFASRGLGGDGCCQLKGGSCLKRRAARREGCSAAMSKITEIYRTQTLATFAGRETNNEADFTTVDSSESSYHARTWEDQVQAYRVFPLELMVTVGAVITMLWAMPLSSAHIALLAGIVAIAFVNGLRSYAWFSLRGRGSKTNVWFGREHFGFGLVASGIALGVIGLLSVNTALIIESTAVAMALTATLVTAAVLYTRYCKAVVLFAVVSIFPLIIVFMLSSNPPIVAIGAMSTLVVCAALFLSLRRCQAEIQALTVQQENSLYRAHSRVFAKLEHDLHTPLNMVVGYGDLLAKADSHVAHREQVLADFGRDISAAGRQLRETLDDAVTLMAVDGGRVTLANQEVCFEDLIRSVVRGHSGDLDGRSVVLDVKIPAPLPLFKGDSKRLLSVVEKLVAHASRVCESGDRIEILANHQQDGSIVLIVTDTAPTLCDSSPDGYSNRTQNGERRRSWSADGGAGLELSLAQSLTRLHGGTFKIAPSGCRGNQILVTFPAKRVI